MNVAFYCCKELNGEDLINLTLAPFRCCRKNKPVVSHPDYYSTNFVARSKTGVRYDFTDLVPPDGRYLYLKVLPDYTILSTGGTFCKLLKVKCKTIRRSKLGEFRKQKKLFNEHLKNICRYAFDENVTLQATLEWGHKTVITTAYPMIFPENNVVAVDIVLRFEPENNLDDISDFIILNSSSD